MGGIRSTQRSSEPGVLGYLAVAAAAALVVLSVAAFLAQRAQGSVPVAEKPAHTQPVRAVVHEPDLSVVSDR